MAGQLKRFFNEARIREIAGSLHAAYPRLDVRRFVADAMRGLEQLELIARGEHLAEVMRRHLPQDFKTAADVLERSLGPHLDATEGWGMAPFRYLPHVAYVRRYGVAAGDFEPAMRVQYELTKRFSAEWSIRPFLETHREQTLARLREWARDPSAHVRRLVSEGTRPRLPWAPRLRAFQEDPAPVLALLELLKDDTERYVQRSVANNLNDIARDHPALAVATCERWLADAPPGASGRRWIVGHALRSLVKAGDARALGLLGFGGKPKVVIENVALLPRPRVRIGGELRLSFEMVSTSAKAQELAVDFAVHFVKKNGARRPKVFKLKALTLAPRARAQLAAKVSFANLTTRTHFPGAHRVDAIVNGTTYPLAEFDVR
ncbi:MAG TPA: DNA alkylation repair protein [Kofleriaceae bacterium]|nr:DNA alkylation repair protein [Kofleriaceae bacterium]